MRRIAALCLASVALFACKDDKKDSPPPPPPYRTAAPIAAGSPTPVTTWAQTVEDTAGLGEAFPGQANTWVVDRDFSLGRGFGLQYQSALVLLVGTPTDAASHASLVDDVLASLLDAFPYDQNAADVTFLTPFFTAADGVATATSADGSLMGVLPLAGARSGFLNGTSESRLSRTLALEAAKFYTLSWSDAVVPQLDALVGATSAPHAPWYQVVLRDPGSGAALAGGPLYETSETAAGNHTVALPAGLTSVVLSFEFRSGAGGFAAVDDVVLADVGGPVALENGDFEAAALAPWVANAGAESQNVRSAPRTVGGLSITRTIYAPPAAPWARVVDVFENPGTTAVTTKAVYLTLLSVDAPRVAARQSGAAVVAWDPAWLVRDVGFVSGDGAAVVEDGSPFVFTVHDVTVPPGGSVALAHFVVQLGGADGGPLVSDVPELVDGACAAVVSGFPGDEAYAIDLEPGVLDLIQNF